MFYLHFLLSSIPLPSLPRSIEWLKLRSALTTNLVPQPLTSNPQPKPYRYSPATQFLSNQTKSRYVSIQENRAFRKASYDDANLTKSPEIRRFSAFIYLSLTANTQSPHVPYSQTDPQPHISPLHILSPVSSPNPLQDLSPYMKYTQFYPPDNPIS